MIGFLWAEPGEHFFENICHFRFITYICRFQAHDVTGSWILRTGQSVREPFYHGVCRGHSGLELHVDGLTEQLFKQWFGLQALVTLVKFFMNKIKSINTWVYILSLVAWPEQVGGWMLAGWTIDLEDLRDISPRDHETLNWGGGESNLSHHDNLLVTTI